MHGRKKRATAPEPDYTSIALKLYTLGKTNPDIQRNIAQYHALIAGARATNTLDTNEFFDIEWSARGTLRTMLKQSGIINPTEQAAALTYIEDVARGNREAYHPMPAPLPTPAPPKTPVKRRLGGLSSEEGKAQTFNSVMNSKLGIGIASWVVATAAPPPAPAPERPLVPKQYNSSTVKEALKALDNTYARQRSGQRAQAMAQLITHLMNAHMPQEQATAFARDYEKCLRTELGIDDSPGSLGAR